MIKKRHLTYLCGSSKMAHSIRTDKYECYDHYTKAYWKSMSLEESENYLPWYKQSHPVPCLENDKAKVLWDIQWHLEKCPRNSANKYACTGRNEQEVVHNGWNCVRIKQIIYI